MTTNLLALELVLQRDAARRLLFGEFAAIFRAAREAAADGHLAEAELHRLAYDELVAVLDRDEDCAIRRAAEKAIPWLEGQEFFNRRTLRRDRLAALRLRMRRLESGQVIGEGGRAVPASASEIVKDAEVVEEGLSLLGHHQERQLADSRQGVGRQNLDLKAPCEDMLEPEHDLDQGDMDSTLREGLRLPVDHADDGRAEPRVAPSEGRAATDFIRHPDLSRGLQPGEDAESPAGVKPAGGGAAAAPEFRP